MRMLQKLLLLVLVANATGCAYIAQDRRDAPWDPRPGQSLMDQIPPWDSAASKICCGHLRECRPGQSPRC